MIEIKEVLTKKQLKVFTTYPLKLYKDCPYYVPSLIGDEMGIFNPKKNFNLVNNICKAFLCYKDGELVGRIAGLINTKDNVKTGKKLIRFSRFDAIDDIEVFKALIGAVEKFGKDNGMEIIHGPWGFNDTDREGMLTYGFDKRSTYATNYYYPYFSEHMKELGFEDESKWIEFNFKIPDKVDEKISKVADMVMKKYNLHDALIESSLSDVEKYHVDAFFDTLNEAYGHLDGYNPIEGDAKKNVLHQFATIINPRYASILMNEENEVAGFGIVLPSIVKPLMKHKGKLFPTGFIGILRSIKKPKELEMALIAVKKKYKNCGINAVILKTIIQHMIEDGIEHIESNPMLETNFAIQQQWKFMEHEIVKKRQTYQKTI